MSPTISIPSSSSWVVHLAGVLVTLVLCLEPRDWGALKEEEDEEWGVYEGWEEKEDVLLIHLWFW